MHRGARVRLGEDQQFLLLRLGAHLRRQLAGTRLRVRAEDAQPGPRAAAQDALLALHGEVVLAVAQEGEVLVGQPLQQLAGLLHLALGDRQVGGVQAGGDGDRLLVHLRPVLDRLTDVVQHLLQVLLERAVLGDVGDPLDLQVHPALADQVVPVGGRAVVEDLLQRAGHVAPDHELRVDQQLELEVALGDRHRGAVHQERHVVDDDLDHGPAARGPAVILERRGEDVHLRRTLRAGHRGLVVVPRGAQAVVRLALGDVLGRDVPVVLLEERLQLARVGRLVVTVCPRGHRLGEHIRLLDVQLALHSPPSPHVTSASLAPDRTTLCGHSEISPPLSLVWCRDGPVTRTQTHY